MIANTFALFSIARRRAGTRRVCRPQISRRLLSVFEARSVFTRRSIAGADVVRDQQVHPQQPQSLAQRQELVGVEPDAGAKRGLEQVTIAAVAVFQRSVRR